MRSIWFDGFAFFTISVCCNKHSRHFIYKPTNVSCFRNTCTLCMTRLCDWKLLFLILKLCFLLCFVKASGLYLTFQKPEDLFVVTPAYEVRGKVMFSVCLFTRGGRGTLAFGPRSFPGEGVPPSPVTGPVRDPARPGQVRGTLSHPPEQATPRAVRLLQSHRGAFLLTNNRLITRCKGLITPSKSGSKCEKH